MPNIDIKTGAFILLTACYLSGCATKGIEPSTHPKSQGLVKSNQPIHEVKTKPEVQNRLVCKNNDDERAIQVVKGTRQISSEKDAPCEVVYTKFSKSTVVASSHSSLSYCEMIQKRIQDNLVQGGFSCQ
ncbi:MAG: hypothetical protein AB7F59_03345 [Bdellovibrionales bacterium]